MLARNPRGGEDRDDFKFETKCGVHVQEQLQPVPFAAHQLKQHAFDSASSLSVVNWAMVGDSPSIQTIFRNPSEAKIRPGRQEASR